MEITRLDLNIPECEEELISVTLEELNNTCHQYYKPSSESPLVLCEPEIDKKFYRQEYARELAEVFRRGHAVDFYVARMIVLMVEMEWEEPCCWTRRNPYPLLAYLYDVADYVDPMAAETPEGLAAKSKEKERPVFSFAVPIGVREDVIYNLRELFGEENVIADEDGGSNIYVNWTAHTEKDGGETVTGQMVLAVKESHALSMAKSLCSEEEPDNWVPEPWFWRIGKVCKEAFGFEGMDPAQIVPASYMELARQVLAELAELEESGSGGTVKKEDFAEKTGMATDEKMEQSGKTMNAAVARKEKSSVTAVHMDAKDQNLSFSQDGTLGELAKMAARMGGDPDGCWYGLGKVVLFLALEKKKQTELYQQGLADRKQGAFLQEWKGAIAARLEEAEKLREAGLRDADAGNEKEAFHKYEEAYRINEGLLRIVGDHKEEIGSELWDGLWFGFLKDIFLQEDYGRAIELGQDMLRRKGLDFFAEDDCFYPIMSIVMESFFQMGLYSQAFDVGDRLLHVGTKVLGEDHVLIQKARQCVRECQEELSKGAL